MSPIRTLVVEDQPIARDRLVELLQSEPDIEIVGATDSGTDAVAAIRGSARTSSFSTSDPRSRRLRRDRRVGHGMPLTIFVTAYDEYALRAFDVHAFDYLLKPFGRERFQEALGRPAQDWPRGVRSSWRGGWCLSCRTWAARSRCPIA